MGRIVGEMQQSVATPFGTVTLCEEAGRIVALRWHGGAADRSEVLDAGCAQVAEYFAGRGGCSICRWSLARGSGGDSCGRFAPFRLARRGPMAIWRGSWG